MEHVVFCHPHGTDHSRSDPNGFTISDKPSLLARIKSWLSGDDGIIEEPFGDYDAAHSRFKDLCDPDKNETVYIMDEFGHVTDHWRG